MEIANIATSEQILQLPGLLGKLAESFMVPSDVKPEFAFIELAAMVASGKMVRNVFVGVDEPDRRGLFRQQHRNTDIYESVARWMQRSRQGPCLVPFFLDIDAEDLEVARQECVRAGKLLDEKVGIAPEAVDWRFSGKKGFHAIVPQGTFGSVTTNDDLPILRSLARRLAREGVSHIDLSVYQAARVLRLPNSINSKSGLYDIPLEYAEIRDLDVGYITDQARSPRDCGSLASEVDGPRAAQWLFRARQWLAKHGRDCNRSDWRQAVSRSGWRFPLCVRRVEQATLPDGVRHDVYFTLARFYASVGMAEEEAIERLSDIDRRNPIRDPEYIERAVHNAGRFPGFSGCPNRVLERFCDCQRCFLNHQLDSRRRNLCATR